MAKFDIKSAYRQIPIHPDDSWLLGMEWKGQLYVDTPLPLGLRSAPMIFNAVAEALAYVIWQKGVDGLDHYLEDFAVINSPKSAVCVQTASETCEDMGFPVARERRQRVQQQSYF